MKQPIWHQNEIIAHLHENEVHALKILSPYWGLWFDDEKKELKPALKEKLVQIKSIDEPFFLHSLLRHTHVQFTDDSKRCDLTITVSTLEKQNQKSHIPITITINHVNYHLKNLKNDFKDLQSLIHRNVWLPKRSESFTVAFCGLSYERQMETIAYLIIQYFLREKMTPISHLSLPIYEHLIHVALRLINDDFGLLQKKLAHLVWPESPPELSTPQNETNDFPSPSSSANVFHPFKTHSNAFTNKKINPFKKDKKPVHLPINPFKKISGTETTKDE